MWKETIKIRAEIDERRQKKYKESMKLKVDSLKR
jgi:hypothetical protein